MTRVTIDCVETIIDGHPVILFNSPSPLEGREMICVPATQNCNYAFFICTYIVLFYICLHAVLMCLINWCLLIIARVSTVPSFEAPLYRQIMNIAIADVVSSILMFFVFKFFSFGMVTKWCYCLF